MIVGVCRETYPGEKRVALVPASVSTLIEAGLSVSVQSGSGESAGFDNAAYEAKGAKLVPWRQEVFASAGVVLQVRGFGANPHAGRTDLGFLRAGQATIGFHEPLSAPESLRELAKRGVVTFAMELIPRVTRAQGMDALSSMATVAGYKAVLLAAGALPRMFPMLMTAAGTVAPARVLVIGAGVAGLQAVATARRLGAVVQAYDVRPAVKEQVESLGAKFVDLGLEPAGAEDAGGYAKAMDEEFYRRQREVLAQVVAGSNVVITTAAVPGARAPVLVARDMVQAMDPGSVIVDLAAETGGNCELTRPGEIATVDGVTIIGLLNLPASVPYHSSQMYARNMTSFLLHLVKEDSLAIDLDDEITRETLVTRDGEIVHPRIRELLDLPPLNSSPEENS